MGVYRLPITGLSPERIECDRVILTERLRLQGWKLGDVDTFLRNAGYPHTAQGSRSYTRER